MSTTEMGAIPVETKPGEMHFPKISLDGILAWIQRRDVQIGALLLGLLLVLFSEVTKNLIDVWTDTDSYYQHGPIVPLAVGYILFVYREKIEKHPIKPAWWLFPVFAFLCIFDVVATWAHFYVNLHTLIFFAAFLVLAAMIYGFRRFFAMLPALGFLSMGLPLWNRLIDDNTSNAQILSTKGAYYLLDIAGFQPHMQQSFLIFLDNYQLNVGVACSGMKLTLALIATVIFILLVAKLKWWANLILVAVAIPLALAINSLRIALIGILGETIGPDAGTWMHDYGSYGTLLLAFWLLYILAKKLGWKV